MSDSSLFLSSALPWLRRIDEDGAREIFERMDNLLWSPKRQEPLVITVRADNVFNSRRQWVVTAAEQLSRWDSRPPNEVFRTGFLPHVTPDSLDDFRALDDTQVHLYRYVFDAVRSVFVSATRFVMHEGRQSAWYPGITRDRYQYEIYAYGGIDIQLTFHEEDIPPYYHQQEITFVGGIRPGLIRSARQYDDRGQVIRVWRNLHFNPLLNREHAPRVADLPRLPDIVDTTNFLILDAVDGDGEGKGRDELFLPSADATSKGGDDACDYRLVPDPWAAEDAKAFPLARACMLRKEGVHNHALFFGDTRFVRIDLQTDENLTNTIGKGGVQEIVLAWSSLHKVQFPQIDGVLPSPKNPDEAYFFCNDKCALIDIKTDTPISKAKTITNEWSSLRQARFNTIDATFLIGQKAYFFRGEEYIRVLIRSGTNRDVLEVPPTRIIDGWPSLRQAGFDTVDTALRSPRADDEVYFFKGDKYALVRVNWSMFRYLLCLVTVTNCHTNRQRQKYTGVPTEAG